MLLKYLPFTGITNLALVFKTSNKYIDYNLYKDLINEQNMVSYHLEMLISD